MIYSVISYQKINDTIDSTVSNEKIMISDMALYLIKRSESLISYMALYPIKMSESMISYRILYLIEK